MAKVQSMTSGSPLRLMVRFSLPLMLGNLLQMGYTFADSAIVGRLLGVEAFAAVGATYGFHWLVLGMVFGLSQGFGILISQHFGAGDIARLHKSIAMSTLLTALLGVLISVLSFSVARPVLTLMGAPPEVLDGAVAYIRVLFGGMWINFLQVFLSGLFYALGNSRIPQIAMVISSCMNIVLDILLIRFTNMGVIAAAFATVIAQLFSLLFCFWHIRKIPEARPARGDWRLDRPLIRKLLRLSLPLSVQDVPAAMASLLIQSAINAYGTLFVAGITVAKNMHSALFMICHALNRAVGTYVAQNYGARDFGRVHQGMREGLRLMLVSSALLSLLFFLIGRPFMSIFISGDPQTIAATLDIAQMQLRVSLLLLPGFHLTQLYRAAVTALGDSRASFIAGLLETGARLFAIYVLMRWLGEWGIFIAEAIGWPIMALYLGISYFRDIRRLEASEGIR